MGKLFTKKVSHPALIKDDIIDIARDPVHFFLTLDVCKELPATVSMSFFVDQLDNALTFHVERVYIRAYGTLRITATFYQRRSY